MAIILLTTEINAPILSCFNLSRSINLHTASVSGTHEKAIGGRTSGLIELNETVTWRAKHFGIYQKLTVKITEFNSPNYFKDVMLKGAFKRMEHKHLFEEKGNKTLMRDEFEFEAPFGLLGKIVENLFLKTYLRQFLEERNKLIKSVAESDEWRNFLTK